MKSNEKFVEDLIMMTKKARQKRRIRRAATVCACVGSLALFVGCSNILSFNSQYLTAYQKYLTPYIFVNEEGDDIAFKFVSETSAVVSVGETVYSCYVDAKDEDSFVLTNTSSLNEEVESPVVTEETNEEEPSIFYLDFWEDKAKISFSFLGIEVEEILSITDEMGVPQGVWKLFATQSGEDDELIYKEDGGGWTIILENGDSYTGEGKDSAWVTKFISIQNRLFQCIFDSKSGVILDASIVEYDETTFGYPVIIERYVSDGDPFYFYSRLIQEEEKTDFKGGTFTSGAVLYESEIRAFPEENLLVKSVAKWQLLPETPTEEKQLDVVASLDLKSDGSAVFKTDGERKYRCEVEGQWFALQDSVLVVLEEKTSLVGTVFTVYVSDSIYQDKKPTQTDYAEQARSRLELFKCYKLGYRNFSYYAMFEGIKIYWGSDYSDGNITPKLVYEKKYVLDALWFEGYYVDKDFSEEKYKDKTELTPCYANGKMFLVFHENGTFDVTYPSGVTLTKDYTKPSVIELSGKIYIYSTFDGGREDLRFGYLNITHEGLVATGSYVYSSNGVQVERQLYVIRFVLCEE